MARRLIDPRIARVRREDRAHGGHADRARCWPTPAADLNAKAAAEALLIHVNTAHHRLGRIEEKTGRDLRRLPDVIDLLIAVRLRDEAVVREAGGLRLRVGRSGEGPPLLLITGIGANIDMWAPFDPARSAAAS